MTQRGHQQPHDSINCAICAWIEEETRVLQGTARWVQEMLDFHPGPNVTVNVNLVRRSAEHLPD